MTRLAGADFLHSLMGEAGDKLSQASVTDLSAKMDSAQTNGDSQLQALSSILKKLPIGGGDETASQGEEMQAQAKAYHFDPDNVAPPHVQKQLLDLLKWRDQVYRDIVAKIEMIPGLADLMDELTNALNAYVFTVLAPYLTPILQQVTGVLDDGSKAVIDSDDQYAVFNDRNASDPSHSMLSKDHFGLILNEPAGKIAQVVVEHTVNLIVKAWSDDSDPNEVLNEVLEAFHHPYYATEQSSVQHRMFEMLQEWLGGLGPDMEAEVINNLSKDSVRNGKNKRVGSETDEIVEYEKHGHSHGGGGATYNTHQEDSTPSYQHQEEEEPSYNRQESYHRSGGYDEHRNEESSHENRYNSHGDGEDNYQSRRHGGYGGGEEEEQSHRYGGDEDEGHQSRRYGGGEEDGGYQSRRYGGGEEEENSYSSRRHGGDEEENSYSSRRYGGGEEEENSYSSRRHGGDEEENSYGSRRYGGGEDEGGYNSRRYGGGGDEEDHSRRYGGGDESSGYGFQRHRAEEDEGGYQGGGGHRYGRQEESSYEGSQGYTFGSSGGFGGGGYGGGEEHSGYNPSYERNDDTYGAERLNLGDDHEGYRYGDE
ncbi:hypothetical protein ONZ45_g19497 [Pleurotus djamor]|nr:hypothetical protein ONZ45_g19497 [Pleurotus djamor]